MTSDFNSIDNIGTSFVQSSIFQPQISQPKPTTESSADSNTYEPLNSFADEDQAIISSEANLLYQLDKFNSGGNNDVDLALANVTAKTTTEAEVNVINTKKDMLDTVLKIGEQKN